MESMIDITSIIMDFPDDDLFDLIVEIDESIYNRDFGERLFKYFKKKHQDRKKEAGL